jgi:hypothetical protein
MRVSWTYLKAHIINGKLHPGCLMTRDTKTHARYLRFKDKKRDLRVHILKRYLKNKRYALVPNAFPYELRKGIDHYVLFAVEPVEPLAISTLLKLSFPGRPILWYINEPHLQSIPTVWHCQVFVK